MKNTNITNKYLLAIGTLLLIAVFAVGLPIAVSAQEYTDGGGYYTDGGGYDYTDGGGYGYTDGGGYYETSPSAYYVSGGSYYGGGYYGYPSYYSGSTVTSGSFSGGNTYNVTPTYTYLTPTVSSGSFNGGNAYGYNYGYNYGALNGSCSASFNTGVTNGPMVTWTASASGGNGIYNYYWTGDEGLVASGQYVSKTYVTNGVKNAYLTISSGDGQTITRTCSATVGNQVLAYSATNPTLQSIYLSDVPATGAGDVAKVIGFLSMLLLWSAGLSYIFLKRKEKMENPIVASVAASDMKDNANSLQNFQMEISSDKQAIESIETYARMNKVLLSSDAVMELAKLSRLNKINPKNAIREMSQNQWTAVGEKDLAKYL